MPSNPPRVPEARRELMARVGYTIVRILQRFERISKYWQDGGTQFKCEVVLSPKDGVKVGFWEAQIA